MAPVVVHLNGGCCSPSTFEKLAQPVYDQEIEQINVTYGRRQWCTSKLGPAIALITCTGFVLIFCGILAFFGSIGDFAEEIGEPCRRRLQTGSCCIATAGGDQFLCQSSTEFFCTGAGKRCTWTCAAPPPPPGGTSDTSGCDEEDVKPPLLNVFIRLGFVIFLAGIVCSILYAALLYMVLREAESDVNKLLVGVNERWAGRASWRLTKETLWRMGGTSDDRRDSSPTSPSDKQH